MRKDLNQPRLGDRLVRTKNGVFTMHHALYMGLHNGIHWVAENQVGYGVRYIRLEQFLSEGTLVRIEPSYLDWQRQNELIHRVNNAIGLNYYLLKYNCEQFVNHMLYGIPYSKQVRNAALVAGGIGITILLAAMVKNNSRNSN